VEEVEEALEHHPSRADGGWSADTTSCWRADGVSNAIMANIACKSYSSGRHLLEKKKLHAVAEFVVRYVGFIRAVLLRYRPPAPTGRLTWSRAGLSDLGR